MLRGVMNWMFMEVKSESHSVVSKSLQPQGLYSPWNSPGQDTRVGSLSLHRIFPTQGSNPGLLPGRWIFFTSWATKCLLPIHIMKPWHLMWLYLGMGPLMSWLRLNKVTREGPSSNGISILMREETAESSHPWKGHVRTHQEDSHIPPKFLCWSPDPQDLIYDPLWKYGHSGIISQFKSGHTAVR